MDIKRQRRPGKNKFDNFLVTAHPELDIKGTYQNINGQKSLQNVVLINFYGEIKKEIIIQNVYYNAKITFNKITHRIKSKFQLITRPDS